MAQVSDTTGYTPNLPKYQRKEIRHQDSKVSNPNAGIVQEADAKMWDSVSNSLQSMIAVRSKMNLISLDMEKGKMRAEMNDYYLDQQNAMKEGVNGLSDVLLNGSDFEDNYENGKLKVGAKGESIQPFKFNEKKWSQKAIEQMSPMLKEADDQFRSSTRDLFWGNLQERNKNYLNTLESRNFNALTNQLVNYTKAHHEEEMTKNADIHTGNIQFKGKILGGREGRYMQAKQGILEDDFRNYRNVLKLKLESEVMNQQQIDMRIHNYGKALGEIMFNDIASVDPDEALELALNGEIRISKGTERAYNNEDMEDIVYSDTRITQFHLNKIKKDKDDLIVAKRNLWLNKLNFQANTDYELFQNIYGPWIKDATEKGIHYGSEVKGQKLVDSDFMMMGRKTQRGYKLKEMTPGELVPKKIKDERKYTDQDRKNLLGHMFKAMGEKNGFTSPQQMESAILQAILVANGKQESADKLAETERKQEITKNTLYLKSGLEGRIKNKNRVQAYNDISIDYEEQDGRWIPKESAIKSHAELIGAKPADIKYMMEGLVDGLDVEKPGSGMGDKMSALENAINNYWTKRIMLDPSTNKNEHPFEDQQKYFSHLMNEEDRKIIANLENGYKEIEFFNKDNFRLKSSNQLEGEAQALLRKNTNDLNQRTTAFAYLWNNYYNNTVKKRMTALKTDANKVVLQDLNYDFAFHLPLKDQNTSIPQEIRDKMDDWFEKSDQWRKPIRFQSQGPHLPDKPIYSYLPETIITDTIVKMMPAIDKDILQGKDR